jgi:hypothetical protein
MRKSNLYLKGSRKCVGRDQPQHACERLLRVPEVVLLLPLEPEAGGRAGEAGKAGRHLRSDSSLPGKNPVKRLTRDAKLPGRLADGETQAGQDVIAQDPARMGRSHRESVSGAGHDLNLAGADCSVMGDRSPKTRASRTGRPAIAGTRMIFLRSHSTAEKFGIVPATVLKFLTARCQPRGIARTRTKLLGARGDDAANTLIGSAGSDQLEGKDGDDNPGGEQTRVLGSHPGSGQGIRRSTRAAEP